MPEAPIMAGPQPRPSLFARKPLAALQPKEDGHTLRRALGPLSLLALGIGAIVGAGLFSLTGIAAAENAGPAVVLAFVIAGIGCGFAGMCYSELAGMIPAAGSAYTYSYATLGELAAWIIGWDLVLEYAVGAGTVAVSWSRYLAALLGHFGVALPPRLMASPFESVPLPGGGSAAGLVNLPAIAVVVLLSLLLMRGIQESARVNAVIVVVKLAVVLAVIGFGAFFIDTANYVPFVPPNAGQFGHFGWSGVLRAAGVLFFAYIGFDAVSTAAQEAHDPQRTMPIGILGSLAVCTVLYIAFGLVLTGLVNYRDLAGDAHPVVTAIARTPFHWLELAVTIGILCGFTTVILVLLLGQSRVAFAMAEDRLLPRIFGTVHPRFRTPYLSNAVFMLGTGLVAGLVPIEVLGHMTSIGTLFAFTLVCTGVLVLRRTDPDAERGYRVPFVPAVPVLGILVCLAMMVSLGIDSWLRLAAWLVLGLAVYFLYGRRHSRVARNAARDTPRDTPRGPPRGP